MKKGQSIKDIELGTILLRENVRARSLIFRVTEEGVRITMPPGFPMSRVTKALEELRPRLLQQKQSQKHTLIDLNFRIDAEFFKLTLIKGREHNFFSRSQPGSMEIICPPDTDFGDAALQSWLHKVVEEGLRRQGKAILPPRLEALAKKYGMVYKSVKVNSSKSRWGSCSQQGNINLSYFLLLLPSHLVDYVLLHELAHTREMNHGPRFWEVLNGMTDGQAHALRNELRHYRAAL